MSPVSIGLFLFLKIQFKKRKPQKYAFLKQDLYLCKLE